jgi:hypothetical protein
MDWLSKRKTSAIILTGVLGASYSLSMVAVPLDL